MALNNDLAPTRRRPRRRCVPRLRGQALTHAALEREPPTWRTAFLIEHKSSGTEYGYVRAIPEYYGVRTAQYSYVEYETGEKELYDLNADPTEMTNIYYGAAASVPPRPDLKARLDALKDCQPDDPNTPEVEMLCQKAEDGP